MSTFDCSTVGASTQTAPAGTTEKSTTKSDRKTQLVGLFYNAIAAVALAVSGAIIQHSELGGQTASFGVGYLGTLSGLVGFFGCSRNSLTTKQIVKIFLNGFFIAGIFNFLYFLSLDSITVGDATAVNYFSAFVFCILLETICFKFCPHWCTVISALIGLAGLVCICFSQSQSAGSGFELNLGYVFGVLLSIASGFFGALFFVIMHKWTKVPVCLLVSSCFTGCCLFPLPWMVSDNMELQTESILKRLLALFGYACYVSVGFFGIKGSRLSLPSLSFLVKLLSIVLCYILQIFWLEEEPSMLSVVGSCLICVSILLQSAIAVITAPSAQIA